MTNKDTYTLPTKKTRAKGNSFPDIKEFFVERNTSNEDLEKFRKCVEGGTHSRIVKFIRRCPHLFTRLFATGAYGEWVVPCNKLNLECPNVDFVFSIKDS